MTTYKAISSDSHIIEPHDLWEKRIDAPYRDRAPVLVREGEYHQWYCEGVPFGLIGINQQAGTALRGAGEADPRRQYGHHPPRRHRPR